MATQFQVIQLNAKSPQLTASQIAVRLETSSEYVRATGRRLGLTFPGARKSRVRQEDSLKTLGEAARAAGLLTVEAVEAAAKALRP